MKKYTMIIIFIFYLIILKYLSHILMPFLFAFLFYILMKPIIDYFDSHALSISILALIYLLLMGLIFVICYLFYQGILQYQIIQLLLDIPYFNQIITVIINSLTITLYEIPNLILSIIVFVVATFLLVMDYKDIRLFITKSMNYSLIRLFIYYKDQCQKSIMIYCKCQFIILFICFIHVFMIFCILRIPHSLFYSMISSILDALPFIGIGIVFIPLMIYYVINECYLKGIYVFLIFIWISFLRNILETKMMNMDMKIPSFIMLLSMVLHIHFYGLLGVILSPIHISILYNVLLDDS
ncbi:MAG: AI-2E family transporter [Erysipelotrichaceae bacterium]|nr:AI-2E family transporter [Erysipelotrichaceae bacterium]